MGVVVDGTDLGVREQLAALRDEGRLGARPATPPPQLLTFGGRAPFLAPAAPLLPREVVMQRAVEAVETVTPPRFPRADLMLEALGIADRCRVAASALEAVAANARDYEPSTLRHYSHGIVRALFAELEGRVTL